MKMNTAIRVPIMAGVRVVLSVEEPKPKERGLRERWRVGMVVLLALALALAVEAGLS
jgi:hypothetical protein